MSEKIFVYNTDFWPGFKAAKIGFIKVRKNIILRLFSALGIYKRSREWKLVGFLSNYDIERTIKKIIYELLEEIPEAKLKFGLSVIWDDPNKYSDSILFNNSPYAYIGGGGSSEISLVFKSDADEAYFIARNIDLSEIILKSIKDDTSLVMTP
jgi:hypothetical protein